MIWILCAVLAPYTLWVFYLAAMALVRARDDGVLTRRATALGLPVVAVGLAIDVMLNWTLFTVVFLDKPRERTLTLRLRRLIDRSDWRGKLARWLAAGLLDPFDRHGKHV